MHACATEREAKVREAFAAQAQWGERLGSPLTAMLCTLVGERIDDGTRVGRRLLDWPGDPSPEADNVGGRVCAGLQYLARTGAAPALLQHYPPAPLPDGETLWEAVAPLLEDERLDRWLDSPPQTNEVGRSAILFAGLMEAAARYPLPIRLFELGSSAGLNLLLDRYRYDLGGVPAGDAGSPLLLSPEWHGPPPARADVAIAGRAGVDLRPSHVRTDGEKLLAYVWAGHEERRERLRMALEMAAASPPPVAQGDAAEWLEKVLPAAPAENCLRVVMHSVAYQYFPEATQRRIAATIEGLGHTADQASPIGWLRYEQKPGEPTQSLRLRLWPDGEDRLLAWCHPHGREVNWVG